MSIQYTVNPEKKNVPLNNNEFNVLEKSLKFMGVNVVFLPEVVCVERGSCVV